MKTTGMGGLLFAFAGSETEIKIYTRKSQGNVRENGKCFGVRVQDHPWGLEIVLQKYQVWFLGAQQNSAVPERYGRKFCVIVFQHCIGWIRFSVQESVRQNGYPSFPRYCVGWTPAQRCRCNSCYARRDVPGNDCTAIQAARAKEPYSLCLNQKIIPGFGLQSQKAHSIDPWESLLFILQTSLVKHTVLLELQFQFTHFP